MAPYLLLVARTRKTNELNPNDSTTRTRGVVHPARVCIPTVEADPFDPASCKPNFRCPTPTPTLLTTHTAT